ncbi:MAG: UDP-N-acetylmuramate dehydrogenase [Candidatus Omnitrophica bacterium]|nr:UDP-N-acetylmuramate dehydrogenase [Candidatus Omnitrophota bacterium]
MESFQTLKKSLKGKLIFGEPLSRHTTFCIGGPAKIWAEPSSEDDLRKLITFAKRLGLKFVVLGAGSNILASDKGFEGLILMMSSPQFSNLEIKKNQLKAGAGAKLARCVYSACKHSLSGMEGLFGIPGTVGGAIIMNSGYKTSIGKIVKRLRVMDRNGKILTLKSKDLKFVYRKSNVCRYIILEAEFALKLGNEKDLRKECVRLRQLRKDTQPWDKPSAGCVFRNPKGRCESASSLIEKCGLKGRVFGGAKISNVHSNFIINNKSASSKDVASLMKLVKNSVMKKFNIALKSEIIKIGS